ncbi:MAG: TIGR00730 family Rossman fold protein [Pseudomonadota bacterium]
MSALHAVAVFCGSNPGARPDYVAAAEATGRAIAEAGLTLVYGGASVGCMGALADAALAADGRVVGVIPQALIDKEIAHKGLSANLVTHSMHERKAKMADMADGFIALPGGAGTMEEMFEIWTWGQLGLHHKPLALLDVAGFFDPLRAFLDHQTEERFMKPAHRHMLLNGDDPAELLTRMAAYEPPSVTKWIGPEET